MSAQTKIIQTNAVGMTDIVAVDFNPRKIICTNDLDFLSKQQKGDRFKSVAFLVINLNLFFSSCICRSFSCVCFFVSFVQPFNDFLSNVKRLVSE